MNDNLKITSFLNQNFKDASFEEITRNKFFVDKTELISKINDHISTDSKYICITRPRRFGKTKNATMLASYYSKGANSKNIFDKLNISKDPAYLDHINKHNVIFISFDKLPKDNCTYEEFINFYEKRLIYSITANYPGSNIDFQNVTISEIFQLIFQQTGERFIFIIDEWDYIFNRNLFTANEGEQFLQFLKYLLKDQPYVELAYMTGILPIGKYSLGSDLNMFREYNCLNDYEYDKYFGFTEEEVEMLCARQDKVSLQELKDWYDGYHSYNGLEIYNPKSVVYALSEGICMNYWTEARATNEIFDLIKYDFNGVLKDIMEMIDGNILNIKLEGYGTEQVSLDSKEKIFSAMVVYGLLDYHKEMLRIPNKEIREKFKSTLKEDSIKEVAKFFKDSREMLIATLNQDTERMEELIEKIHNEYIPMLEYNDENSLSCVITIAYICAKDRYKIVRECPTGIGFADFIFFPKVKSNPAFILELKRNSTPEEAIQQIKEKKYAESLKDYIGEKLLVGISYDKKTKKHYVKIEEIE